VSDLVLVDAPAAGVCRITLNRPEKRNALNNPLRAALFEALHAADDDPEVRVTIIRGAGTCFSAGYDLGGGNAGTELPFFTAAGEGQWPRHVTEGWMSIWDLAKPVIAQVHGYCLAGGSELATGCDLVYVAPDAKIGYPAVRFGTPDMQFHAWFMGMRAAMEMMLTGDPISGDQAVELGWANRAFPADSLDDEVVAIASRIALIPPGHRPAEQAHGPPSHGRHGPPRRHPLRHRAVRPRHPPTRLPRLHRRRRRKGPRRRLDRTRRTLRRLPHLVVATLRAWPGC